MGQKKTGLLSNSLSSSKGMLTVAPNHVDYLIAAPSDPLTATRNAPTDKIAAKNESDHLFTLCTLTRAKPR